MDHSCRSSQGHARFREMMHHLSSIKLWLNFSCARLHPHSRRTSAGLFEDLPPSSRERSVPSSPGGSGGTNQGPPQTIENSIHGWTSEADAQLRARTHTRSKDGKEQEIEISEMEIYRGAKKRHRNFSTGQEGETIGDGKKAFAKEKPRPDAVATRSDHACSQTPDVCASPSTVWEARPTRLETRWLGVRKANLGSADSVFVECLMGDSFEGPRRLERQPFIHPCFCAEDLTYDSGSCS